MFVAPFVDDSFSSLIFLEKSILENLCVDCASTNCTNTFAAAPHLHSGAHIPKPPCTLLWRFGFSVFDSIASFEHLFIIQLVNHSIFIATNERKYKIKIEKYKRLLAFPFARKSPKSAYTILYTNRNVVRIGATVAIENGKLFVVAFGWSRSVRILYRVLTTEYPIRLVHFHRKVRFECSSFSLVATVDRLATVTNKVRTHRIDDKNLVSILNVCLKFLDSVIDCAMVGRIFVLLNGKGIIISDMQSHFIN